VSAPVLSADGGGNISWTWSDAEPDNWRVEQSSDGGITWLVYDDLIPTSRNDDGLTPGNLVRVFGTDALFNPVTGVSNVVTAT